jgi:hypothetical protein
MNMADSATPDKGQTCPVIREATPRQRATKFQTFD